MTELTYARVGGPPDDWYGLEVIDLATGRQVKRVVEVHAGEGWLIRRAVDGEGRMFLDPRHPDRVANELVEGRFRIRRPPVDWQPARAKAARLADGLARAATWSADLERRLAAAEAAHGVRGGAGR